MIREMRERHLSRKSTSPASPISAAVGDTTRQNESGERPLNEDRKTVSYSEWQKKNFYNILEVLSKEPN